MAGGKHTETFIIGKLNGEPREVQTILSALDDSCSQKVFDTLLKLANDPDAQHSRSVVSCFGRLARNGSAYHEQALKALLQMFDKWPRDKKYSVACAIMRTGARDDGVVEYLKKLKEQLEQENPNDGRISYIEGLLKDAEKAE